MQTREIHLKRYPEVLPTPDHFRLVTVDLPDPLDGEVLVRNRVMSVDPYMRGRMRESNPYFTPFAVGAALDGGCIGEVISSNYADLVAGDFVSSFFGWREHFIAPGETLSRVDPDLAPLPTFLGTLGMPGLTAYVGLLDVGEPSPARLCSSQQRRVRLAPLPSYIATAPTASTSTSTTSAATTLKPP